MPSLIANTLLRSISTEDVTTNAIDTTGADFIVLAVCQDGVQLDPIISDSKGNTWNPLTIQNGGVWVRLFWSRPTSVGSGHTFTVDNSAANRFPVIAVQAWSGSQASPFDVENGAVDNNASSLATGSITPSQDNCLIVTACTNTNNSTAPDADSGVTYSDRVDGAGGQSYGIGMAYKIQTTAAAINVTWSNTNGLYGAVIAAFKFDVVVSTPISLDLVDNCNNSIVNERLF